MHRLSKQIRRGHALEAARAELEAQLGASPTVGQWAAFCGLPVEDVMATNARAARAKRQLVTANLRLVNLVVNRHRSRARSLTHQDLMQEGALGLMRAADKFDPARGTAFSTCAVHWIRAAVLRAIQDHDHLIRLPVSQHEVLSKLLSERRALEAAHGCEPTVPQLAAALGVSSAEVRRRLLLISQRMDRPVLPLDSVASSASAASAAGAAGAAVSSVSGHGGGSSSSLVSGGLAAAAQGDVQHEVAAADVRADIARLLESHLSHDEVQAIRLRFGLDLAPTSAASSSAAAVANANANANANSLPAASTSSPGPSATPLLTDFTATYASVSKTTGLRSMREIGVMMHIGKERARYIVRRAMEKLDQIDGLEDYLTLV